MNDLPTVGSGTVASGFRIILWATHYFIQVAADYLGLGVPEQLLKGRVAGHNLVVNVSTDYCDWAHVHQGLKILPLAVGFQVQTGVFARTGLGSVHSSGKLGVGRSQLGSPLLDAHFQ